MSIGQLLEWQWQGYAKYHQNRMNLLLHIFAVPWVTFPRFVAPLWSGH